ncbi:MAG: alpha/beta hydrolase [Pseudomonadota bacterium]
MVTKLLVGALALYAVLVAAMYFGQRHFVYPSDPQRISPAAVGLPMVMERPLRTPDGETLITWWHAPPQPTSPTILYFPGNGGTPADRAPRIRAFIDAGYGLLMLSYRSYGGSTGTPSEAALKQDALLAYTSVLNMGATPQSLFIYGESIGTGVATYLASKVETAGLILDAPFTALWRVAAREYPFLPVQWLSTERYDSIDLIAGIDAPLLVLHGARDPLIPPAMGKALHAAAQAPKQLKIFENGHHSDLFDHGAMTYAQAFITAHHKVPARQEKRPPAALDQAR